MSTKSEQMTVSFETTSDTRQQIPAPTEVGQLSDAELDSVAGGLNPQPLPPQSDIDS